MIADTINRIETFLRENQSLPEAERLELERLLAELRHEAGLLAGTVPALTAGGPIDPGSSIDPIGPDEADLSAALGRLQENLTEFEAAHPRLVGVVNRISNLLANMGI